MNKTGVTVKMAILLMITVGGYACAQKPYIGVDYRLPAAADSLTGQTVFVVTMDRRGDAQIFNQAAKETFKNFNGLFSLSLALPEDQHKMLGAYPLPMLFETAIEQRLEKLGVNITGEPSTTVPVFRIMIHQFNIRLVGRKWMAEVGYEASLTMDNQTVARETVTGNAERMKVIGSGGAEKVIGELFTEMINRLNIERLFQQAKL